jgi:pyruvate dehydrogenase (quinone)
MSRKVADLLWEMLEKAGVKRCYGIVGDALNPVIDALRRNGSIEFIHVRHEEYGVFAAVAEAMGAKGIRIEDPADVREGLAEALAYKDGPVVVDAVVDPFALALPSHVPLHTVKGFTLSVAKQVLSGRMDSVIKTMERNVRLV